jgi:archaellum component FlaC
MKGTKVSKRGCEMTNECFDLINERYSTISYLLNKIKLRFDQTKKTVNNLLVDC